MPAQGWINAGRQTSSRGDAEAFLRGAVRGESVQWLLHAAAQELLATGCAGRVGIWLLGSRCIDQAQGLSGIVVGADRHAIPEEWLSLDPNLSALTDLLEGSAEEIFEMTPDSAHTRLEVLTGITRAVWLPLRVAREPLGLALVAWEADRPRVDTVSLRAIANVLALAISERRMSDTSHIVNDTAGRPEIVRGAPGQTFAQSKFLQTGKMASLGQLLSGVAHELNNPLTSIVGYSQLLLGHGLTSAQAANGRLIHQEAERASRIVRNLLLFARESRPERRAVNLNEIVLTTLALRNYEMQVENIEVEKNLDPRLPYVIADPAQLQQLLLNLLVNAEQAIRQEDNGGSIFVRTHQSGRDHISFEISDTGPGISVENIPQIFDPFFSTKPAGSGTGLGLSIAYSIAQEHGGTISVESKPGRGAKFTVEFPAVALTKAEGEESTPKHLGPVTPLRATRDAHVLIIEDEPTVAQLIADVLDEEGYPVEIALDGRDGLSRALAGHHDLVICDLRMPHLDGRAIYKDLVAKHSPMRKRLVFVTGDTLSPHTMEFLEGSGVPFLAKPFLVEELKAIVANALETEHLARTSKNSHTGALESAQT